MTKHRIDIMFLHIVTYINIYIYGMNSILRTRTSCAKVVAEKLEKIF